MTAPRAREQADPPSPLTACRPAGAAVPLLVYMPYPPLAGRRVSAARGVGSSTPPARSPPWRCSRSSAPSPCPPRPRRSPSRRSYRTPERRRAALPRQSRPDLHDGSNTAGYTLSEVDVRHISSISTSGTMVKVMSDNGSGRPGALVANLDNPSSFPDDSIIGFTAPASTETLAANTVYWVVVNDGRAFGVSQNEYRENQFER